MTRRLTTTIDNALYEALRDFCGPDKAVGAVEVVQRVLVQHSLSSSREAGFLLIPVNEEPLS